MLDYIFYSTFLRPLTLPVSQFQTLAAHIPAVSYHDNIAVPFSHLLQYGRHLDNKKNTTQSLFKQYYRIDWLKEINTELSHTQKEQLSEFLGVFLKKIAPFNKDIWDVNIVSARIYNMLLASHYIFDKNDQSPIAKEYFKSILQQSIYLRRKLKKHHSKRDYILYIIRSLYARICFLEERNHLKPLMITLEKRLQEDFYKDGGHISRNTSFQLKIVDELIQLRNLAVNSGISLPTNIQSVISLSVDYLNFMRHPDGKLAIFNGSYESDADYINKILNISTAELKNNKLIKLKDTGFYRLTAPNITLITDLQKFDSRHQYDYQSMLAFELSIGKNRVFINCGSGDELGNEWTKAMQQPAAHTMPVIDIPNIVPSLKTPIITGKKTLKPFVSINSQGTTIEAAQSYEFGKTGHVTHHRHLTLFKTGKILRGEDTFNMVENDKKLPIDNPACYIRFHLGADITAKSSGTSVVLSVPNHGDWMFTVGSGKIIMEPSIYLGTASMQEVKQIVVKLTLNKPQIKFRWTLQELTKPKKKTIPVLLTKESEEIHETV
ncbi:MAG: putative heparinase superfamily protein [Alphaproteobacteria bacterium]|jgi:uncharacterized heparinase superfamily protein